MNDTTFPWLTTLVVLPLVGAAAVWLLPASARRRARQVAVGISLVTLVVGVLALGVNGLGLSEILLSLFLVPLDQRAAWHEHESVDWCSCQAASRTSGTRNR